MPLISEVWRYVRQRDDQTLECCMCGWTLTHPCSAASLRRHLQHNHRIHFTAESGRGEPQGNDGTGDETQGDEEQGPSDTLDMDSPGLHRSPASRPISGTLRAYAPQLDGEEDEGHSVLGDGDPHPTLTEDELSTLLGSCGPGRGPRGNAGLHDKRRLAGGSPDRAQTWDFFKKLNERCVECSLCRKQLCFHASTASLREHLRRKHRLGHGADHGSQSVGPEMEDKRNRERGGGERERGGGERERGWVPECPERRWAALDRLLLGLVYRDLQPLGLGQQVGFRRLLCYLEPGYRPQSAGQMSAALSRLYLRARQHLAAQLRSVPALALSTHSWSSRGGRPFLTVLAHYTDAHWATVRCALRTGPASGHDLLLSALADYQLPAAAVTCLVEDSPRARAEWPPYILPCARRALDLCLRQTLQLHDLQPALGAARRLAAHLPGPDSGHWQEPLDTGVPLAGQWPEPLDTGVPLAGQWPEPLDTGLPTTGQWPEPLDTCLPTTGQWPEPLDTCVPLVGQWPEPLDTGLPTTGQWPEPLDIGPHWDTLQMCERLVQLRPALALEGEAALCPQHWRVVRDLVSVLRPLRLGLAFLAEPHNASVSALLPCLHAVVAALAQCPLEMAGPARAAGARLRQLLLHRWPLDSGPDVAAGPAAIASLLDPRFKDLRFLDSRTREQVHHKVQALLAATPPIPRPASPCPPPLGPSPRPASPCHPPFGPSPGPASPCPPSLGPSPRPASPCQPPLGPSSGPASPARAPADLPGDYDLLFGVERAGSLPESRQQLDRYLSEPLRKRDTDPFTWWRDNGHRFPALARLARRYLPIPATLQPSLRPDSPHNRGTDAEVEHIVFLHTNAPYIHLLQ
ncbi:LOW QUALITY PROTEIN: uncharacterized protein zbed4l2 [Rhinoraja longicauda]